MNQWTDSVKHSFICPHAFVFQVIIYQGGQIFDGAPQFYGRVGFAMTMPTTSASIFINNTQLSDTGTYQCLVNNLPDRGGRNIGVIGLNVLGMLDGELVAGVQKNEEFICLDVLDGSIWLFPWSSYKY